MELDSTTVTPVEQDQQQEAMTPKTANAKTNPYEDKKAISRRIDRALEVDRFQRALFEREWFRNILFGAGQQWIIYEKGRWRPRVLPSWFPRAQSNKFAEKANDIISALVQGRVPIRYQPATDDPKDIATAEIGERIREVMYEEAEVDSLEMELASWLVYTGNAFLIPYYDTRDEYGTKPVQDQQCAQCGEVSDMQAITAEGGACPNPMCPDPAEANWTPAVDEEGAPIETEFPIGALKVDVCSPFEIRLDHRIRHMKDQQRFIRMRRYDVQFAKEQWTEFADKIAADYGSNDLATYYLDVLSSVTSVANPSGGFIGSGPAGNKNPKTTAYEFYELPSEEFPEGLRAVRIGTASEAVVEAGPLPTEVGAGPRKGKKFLNVIQFRFDVVPGRLWGKTRMDDLISMQIFRNVVEANLRLTAQRMGNAVWLNPKGSGVDIITGEPGQHLQYNPVSLGGTSFAKPERVPAELSNIAPLIALINKIDDTMDRVAGTFFLTGGETPPGVTAASALAYLGERAQKSMAPIMREWAKGWKQFEEMGLEIFRANADDERLRTIVGVNKRWQTERFSKADIVGGVNMVIDYNSLFPKSNATERATIAQLIQLGAVNPQDPEQQLRILEAFGETKLKGSMDIDRQEAIKEADDFMTKDVPPQITPIVENSIVHLLQHNDLAKTDEFKELPQEKKDIWYAHIQATVANLVARQVAFASFNLDPNDPSVSEVGTGEAQLGSQFASSMGGGAPGAPGAPDGAEPPMIGPGVGTPGKKGPNAAAGGLPPTDDIAMGAGSGRAIQAPRAIGGGASGAQ